jgi:hypothetical protein
MAESNLLNQDLFASMAETAEDSSVTAAAAAKQLRIDTNVTVYNGEGVAEIHQMFGDGKYYNAREDELQGSNTSDSFHMDDDDAGYHDAAENLPSGGGGGGDVGDMMNFMSMG